MTHKHKATQTMRRIARCNMAAQTMTHNDSRPKGILLEGGGGRADGKGPTKT